MMKEFHGVRVSNIKADPRIATTESERDNLSEAIEPFPIDSLRCSKLWLFGQTFFKTDVKPPKNSSANGTSITTC